MRARRSVPASLAGYPTRLVRVEAAPLSLQLLVVRRLEDYVDADALLSDPNAPEPPYWAHLWPASRALARLIAADIPCDGRTVLDLGCGIGLVALAAAQRGGRCVAVDHVRAALEFTRANAALNGCTVESVQADLRRPPLRGAVDLCFAADATYDPMLQRAIADLLGRHLAADGRAWCAESVRTFDDGLRRACAGRGLQVTERELHEPEDGHLLPIRLSEIRRN